MYTPGTFQTSASMLYPVGIVYYALFFKGGTQFPVTLWLSYS